MDRGGAETHLVRILPKLRKKGYSLELFVLLPNYDLLNNINLREVRVYKPLIQTNLGLKKLKKFLNFINLLYAFIFLFLFSIFNKKTILHFFLPTSYIIGGLAGYLAGHKKMIMSRRSLNNYQNRSLTIFKYLELFLHRKMNYITGNSTRVVNQLNMIEKVNLSKLYKIYNGIEIPKITEDKNKSMRKKIGINKTDVVFIKVANFINYKGHKDLINAFINVKNSNWKLLLLGKVVDNTHNKIKKLIYHNGLHKNVHILGSQKNVFKFLNISDVGILVSHEEGFSNSLLEYLACGLPVIGTDVGGNNEVVINNYNGTLVKVGDIKEIQAAIDYFIVNKNLRKKYGRNSIRLIKSNFLIEKTIDDYDKLYRKLY